MKEESKQIDTDWNAYLQRATKPYTHRSINEVICDKSILSLCRRINLESPKLVIDFGCGLGSLLKGLRHTKSRKQLSNLRYVAVDQNPSVLEKCKKNFLRLNFPSKAKTSFLSLERFLMTNCYIADYVVMVFTLHEVDVINIDIYLGVLWRMLRRGGEMFIQDPYTPMHSEIEYICFSPKEIKSIMASCAPIMRTYRTRAGGRKIPIYTISLKKDTNISEWEAYDHVDLTSSYLKTVERSVIKDLYEFFKMRTAVTYEGKRIDRGEFLRLIHMIAAKARAYHQTKSFGLFDQGSIDYCLKCGSERVSLTEETIERKTPGLGTFSRSLKCKECGYCHKKIIRDHVAYWHGEQEYTDLCKFLDCGSPLDTEAYRCYILQMFFHLTALIRETVEHLVESIPAVTDDMIAKAKRGISYYEFPPDTTFVDQKTGETWKWKDRLEKTRNECRKLGFGTYSGTDTT